MTPAPARTFTLTVLSDEHEHRWHIRLVDLERGTRFEFDDPEALVRFLERLNAPRRPEGLR